MKTPSEDDIKQAWDMFRNNDENKGDFEGRAAAVVRPGEPVPLWVVVRGIYTALSVAMETAHPDDEATDLRFFDGASGLFFSINWTTELPDEVKEMVEARQ